jgi:DNA repair photolyase
MTPKDAFIAANKEEMIPIVGKTTKKEFLVRKLTYGVLVNNPLHPLSSVSLSNNSMSIDLWTGCAWQCRYCHVQGTLQDLVDNGAMAKSPKRRNSFKINEIIDELVQHPYFIPNKTVLSIGTASTEPFAQGPVVESTFDIMNEFIDRDFKNPFWIVTKAGIPKGRKNDFARITEKSKGLMISLCWADNPDTIEPAKNNRFANIEEAKNAGATIAWHMRPIVPEWSGTNERIEMMLLWVKKNYGNFIDMVVPGGLRWTQGIENGLVEIHGQKMPNIPRDDNRKFLPDDLIGTIFNMCKEYLPGRPVYLKSSCAISHMLKMANISATQTFSRDICELSLCPVTQRRICAKNQIFTLNISHAQNILNKLGVPAKAIKYDPIKGLITKPKMNSFTYAVRQAVFQHIAIGDKNEIT